MTGAPRLALSVYVLLTLATSSRAGQATATVAAPSLTTAQMEDFLLKGRVVRSRDAGVGVTGSRRVTLSDGSLTHDAHVQVVDVERTRFEAGKASEFGFKDSYRFNIGGYRLAALLGVRVPISVRRSFEGKPASFTWWVDDVAMDEAARAKSQARADDPERTSKQLFVMRVFDELIQNQDRNRGNMLWTKDWTLWLIDHTRAFRLEKGLRKSDDLVRIDRALLARLRDLDVSRLRGVMDGVLTTGEIEAVMARRDALVRHFDARIHQVGETAVLFDQN
jgi:hypothetical protein